MRHFLLVVAFCLLITAGCSSSGPAPTPIPTATPIPGYVGGEEAYAYISFVKFYDKEIDECYSRYDPDSAHGVDIDYPGVAVYVGDAIWRFHIRIYRVDLSDPEYEAYYHEDTVEWRSLPDRTWDDKCDRSSRVYDPDDRYDYIEPDYDFNEPSEDSPYDYVRP